MNKRSSIRMMLWLLALLGIGGGVVAYQVWELGRDWMNQVAQSTSDFILETVIPLLVQMGLDIHWQAQRWTGWSSHDVLLTELILLAIVLVTICLLLILGSRKHRLAGQRSKRFSYDLELPNRNIDSNGTQAGAQLMNGDPALHPLERRKQHRKRDW